jgi:Bacterial archaeo-eukaryotic release factor family 8
VLPLYWENMGLHTDIPTRAQIDRLFTSRNPASVSVYVPTDPVSAGVAERIQLGNLAAEAMNQLDGVGTSSNDKAEIAEAFGELSEDEEFWRYQARSLAAFVTPESVVTFRLPHRLVSLVEVSDRFHLKPLLRAVTFPQTAFVLALAQNSVALIEVAADLEPEVVDVSGLPISVADAVGKSSIKDRAPSGRIQGSEVQKVRMRQYSRQIDGALRLLLSGLEVPLILAAAEPMASIYRSVNTYPYLAPVTIPGNPEATPNADLVKNARSVLDELYADELQALRQLYEQRWPEGRTAQDITDVARAATFGGVQTVFVDIDEVVPGTIDETTGIVALRHHDGADHYGVVDEIARRVWLSGGRVLAVRREDIPGEGSVAAILRYPV